MNILIAYRMNQHSKNTAGIFSKMLGQGAAFAELGHEVRVIFMSLNQITLARIDQQATLHVIEQIGPVAKQGERDRFWQLATQLQDCQGWRADMLYARYDMMFEGCAFLDFLAHYKAQNSKVVVEFPTYPYAMEIENEQDREKDAQYVKQIGDHVDLVCSTSAVNEILGVSNFFFTNKLPVPTSKFSESNASLIHPNNQIKLLMVANFKFWHGYDRLLNGVKEYLLAGGDDVIRLDFIGAGEELPRLHELVNTLGLQDITQFHGFIPESELTSLYDQASVCIASLGLHRIDIFNSSTLKSRVALGHGLPVVLANKDEDLVDSPWLLEVEMDESPINIIKLLHFVKTCDQVAFVRDKIRQYAKQNISWAGFAKELIATVSLSQRHSA